MEAPLQRPYSQPQSQLQSEFGAARDCQAAPPSVGHGAASTTNLKVCQAPRPCPCPGCWDRDCHSEAGAGKHLSDSREGLFEPGPWSPQGLVFTLAQHAHCDLNPVLRGGRALGLLHQPYRVSTEGQPAPEAESTAWHRKINQCMKPSQGKQQLLKSHLPINNLLQRSIFL